MGDDKLQGDSQKLSVEERQQIRYLVRALFLILCGVFAASLIMVVVLSLLQNGG